MGVPLDRRDVTCVDRPVGSCRLLSLRQQAADVAELNENIVGWPRKLESIIALRQRPPFPDVRLMADSRPYEDGASLSSLDSPLEPVCSDGGSNRVIDRAKD